MAETTGLQYRAFISYSHADSRWAGWLHRALEGFVLDKDLIGRKTATGTIPETLRPVFRDRNDFTAGGTLSEQTLAALDASAALIVICSPAAAKSEYVNEEIALFKSRHPDRPVIPLIVTGKPGDGEAECFPPALRYRVNAKGRVTKTANTVLAADAREEGDGKDLAVAKVIASLLGLPADDVFRRAERERRAAARRRRRVQGVVATLALLLALGGVVWLNQNFLREQYHWRMAMAPRILTTDGERALKPGVEFSECAHGCPTMVVLPAGKFLMGSPEGSGHQRERPQHEVAIGPFAIGKYEVTFAEWDACVEAGGCPMLSDGGWGHGRMPAINVSWEDAKRYVAWLSKLTGKPYRLPSEAEWEYAARGGTTTAYPFGDDRAALGEYAWHEDNSGTVQVHGSGSAEFRETVGKRPHPVGQKRPNGFGLFDTLGNVQEWVEDYWHEAYHGAPADGSAWDDEPDPKRTPGFGTLASNIEPQSGEGWPPDTRYRVTRGGAWDLAYFYLDAASRMGATASSRTDSVGFRVARSIVAE